MIKWPKVSVVLSNYNGLTLNLLIESLSSILKNNYPNLEVILVDNASTDDSVKASRRKFKKLKIVQNPINMYSQGLNLGILNASGEYVAFFNNDAVVENGYFQKFIKFLEKYPKIALAQGKLLSYYNHDVIDSAGETMDAFGNPITIGAGLSAKDNYNNINKVLSVSGSCSILRKSAVEEIGYFDEDFGIGYEDLDLALRAWMEDYEVIYFPGVSAFHKRGATDLSDMVRVKVRWHYNKNRFITLIKNYPIIFLVKSIPVTIIIYVCAAFWEIFFKGKLSLGLTRFSGIGWVLTHLPKVIAERSKVQYKATEKGKRKIEKLLRKGVLMDSFKSFIKK